MDCAASQINVIQGFFFPPRRNINLKIGSASLFFIFFSQSCLHFSAKNKICIFNPNKQNILQQSSASTMRSLVQGEFTSSRSDFLQLSNLTLCLHSCVKHVNQGVAIRTWTTQRKGPRAAKSYKSYGPSLSMATQKEFPQNPMGLFPRKNA